MCTYNVSWIMFGSDIRAANATAALTLATLGTVGNALSIGLICSGGLKRSAPTMTLILGMCTANLVSTSLLLPVVGTSNLHGMWILGDGLCKAYGYIVYVTLTAESLQLVALTLSQYFTVVHRVTSHKLRRHLPELVGVPWLAASLIYLVPLTGLWEKFGYDPRRGYCTLLSAKGVTDGNGGVFMMLLSALFGVIMTFVNVYCYSAIVYVTHQSRRRTTSSVLEAAARFKGRVRDLQLLRMTSIIFVNFALTYLPFLMMLAIDPCLERISSVWFTVILYVSWSHAVTNPVIYALMNTRINRLWMDFCCRMGAAAGGGGGEGSALDQAAPRSTKIVAGLASSTVFGSVLSDAEPHHALATVYSTQKQPTDLNQAGQKPVENSDGGDDEHMCQDGPSLIVIVKAVLPQPLKQTQPAGTSSRRNSQRMAHANVELEIRSRTLSQSEV